MDRTELVSAIRLVLANHNLDLGCPTAATIKTVSEEIADAVEELDHSQADAEARFAESLKATANALDAERGNRLHLADEPELDLSDVDAVLTADAADQTEAETKARLNSVLESLDKLRQQ
jgi:hypothetical protein